MREYFSTLPCLLISIPYHLPYLRRSKTHVYGTEY